MDTIKNPARSRPLSANVRRLMLMERESPQNPNVMKVEREFTEKDIAYCEMQGEIFMAAIDRGVPMAEFAPMFMTSQLAGVVDYSFSCAKGMETDEIASLLQMPLLLKSPDLIVDVTLWLNNIIGNLPEQSHSSMTVINACMSETKHQTDAEPPIDNNPLPETAAYEYAYWLGYIYRYECILHEESSRMVYAAFSEDFMKDTYEQMMQDSDENITLTECAGEICRRLDALLVGKLWKNKKS